MISKLRRQHVVILGAVACVMVGIGMYYLFIKPIDQQIAQIDKQYQASKLVADTLPSAQQELAAAIREVNDNQARLAKYERTKMPNISFAQRDRGMIDLWHEQIEVLGPILVRWASRGGVSFTSDFNLPAPTTNPNDLPTDIIKIPVGRMTVVGSFRSIMRHIREWNNCPRLAQIDRPSLTGISPALTASYDLTVYIFPRGSAGPQIQMAGGTSGVPGAPGAPPAPMPQAAPPPTQGT